MGCAFMAEAIESCLGGNVKTRVSKGILALSTLALLLVLGGGFGAAAHRTGVLSERQVAPRLVVLLVVDQLPADLLDRYSEAFTGGIRRLLDGGFQFTRATHDHALTATAPGHATISTGVYPSRHGIVGNDWYEEDEDGIRHQVYSVGDPKSRIVGYNGYEGRSPRNLYRGGLADWIEDVDSDARIVSVSRKDRSAITLAGKTEGEVYWLLQQFGQFATSEYYRRRYPGWVRRFNERVLPKMYTDTIWESRIPSEFVHLARPDTSDHEGARGFSFFPHLARAEATREGERGLNNWRYGVPLPDEAVVEFAKTAIRDRDLGQRNEVDFLAVSLSQADAVGHAYGPKSREQLDNLLRVDRLIGELMAFLDEQVGDGNWVMAFTSDHGVSDVPEHLDPPVQRVSVETLRAVARTAQQTLALGGTPSEIAQRIREAIESHPDVRRVHTFEEIEADQPVDSFARLYANSHLRARAVNQLSRFGVYIQWEPHTLVVPSWVLRTKGASHQSPYYYDRWVPLIFYGAGVEPGRSDRAVATVDVAPTLAALAGIPTPDDLDGEALIR